MIDALKISLIAYIFCALGQDEGMIFYPYQRLIKNLPKYISWPLGGCYICFTGQCCLWYFILTKPFNVIDLLFFISLGIFSSVVYNRLYCWLR